MTSRYHPDWVDDAIAESAMQSAKAAKRGGTTNELLARAILAERERCASIAETFYAKGARGEVPGRRIADAIRKGDPT